MTNHQIFVGSSTDMHQVSTSSVNLIVTSPPYPMIEMWDEAFSDQDISISDALNSGDGNTAFAKMHDILDRVWLECDRVLSENGFVCINIGDATRTINDCFQLYSNHTRIIRFFMEHGYSVLPDIHWRKQSNAPNKFMGSGMYPAGAYVTYEHEYILIFRKGRKRLFSGEEKTTRQKSAYFWEERNVWFSDLWEIKGTSQTITSHRECRNRNASYPLEVPYRLVNMYSAEGDTVLDPFVGLGTTSIACMISNRNSIGYEIDKEISQIALDTMNGGISEFNAVISNRVQRHLAFIDLLPKEKKDKCYTNEPHGFYVKTKQETAIELEQLTGIKRIENGYSCSYSKYTPQQLPQQLFLDI